MLSFENDYIAGAHEKILKRLVETNMELLPGYGSDPYCESAKEKIRAACDAPHADVFFLTGGTQTNQLVIDTMLASYEGVVTAESGHVNTHESGAIEYTGHKVLTLPQHQGKIHAEELEAFLRGFWEDQNHEHMVFPGMVYLTHPTEYGTLYSCAELENIAEICHAHQIPLYLDGARLSYALASRQSDVTLPLIASCCDVFYIGGTKTGALCGEAVVFTRHCTPKHFLTLTKQHGALLAKGRLLGIQFDTLFTDDLYLELGRHAIEMAELLKQGLHEKGCEFYLESPTNQQFLRMKDEDVERLRRHVAFSFWEKPDEDHTIIRLATSWSTKEEDVAALMELL